MPPRARRETLSLSTQVHHRSRNAATRVAITLMVAIVASCTETASAPTPAPEDSVGGEIFEPSSQWPEDALGGASSTRTPVAPPVWIPLGVTALNSEGRSGPMAAPVKPTDRFLAIRVRPATPAPDAPWCYGVDHVISSDGQTWIGPLTGGAGAGQRAHGAHRAVPQHGYGVFVLPNDGQSDLPDGNVSFQVVLRDCTYDLPTRRVSGWNQRGRFENLPQVVTVEYATEAAPPAAATGSLELRVAVGRDEEGDLVTSPTRLKAALAEAAEIFADAGVTLITERSAAIDASTTLSVGPGQRQQVDALYERATEALDDAESARYVPVMVVKCVEYLPPVGAKTLLGYTPRIPGGAPFGRSASGVVLATHDCTKEPELIEVKTWGRLMAHELGHHLGLFHSDQALSRGEGKGVTPDLMRSDGAFSPGGRFISKHRRILRRHFDIHFGDP